MDCRIFFPVRAVADSDPFFAPLISEAVAICWAASVRTPHPAIFGLGMQRHARCTPGASAARRTDVAALANLCSSGWIAGWPLAESSGARYYALADDLAISGGEEFARCVERFSMYVAAILHEEGFSGESSQDAHHAQGVRQHLAGLV